MNLKITKFIFILVTALCVRLSAQSQPDYREYHRKVIQAEQMIAMENYSKALSSLEKVFDSYDFVFLKEYKIATQLALFLGDKEKAMDFLVSGISRGWKLKEIKKNKFLKPLMKTDQWTRVKSQVDSINHAYNLSLNQELRQEVHEMFKRDQKMAIGALFKLGQNAKMKYAGNKFAPHSEDQIRKLDRILEKYGYPGEMLIGNDMWMSTIVSHHVSMTREHSLADTLYPAIKPKLKQAIESGKMSPFEFALIDDWSIAVRSDRKEVSYGFLNSVAREDLVTANSMRRAIGMRSIDLRNQLVGIEEKTNMNFYLGGKPWVEGKIEPR